MSHITHTPTNPSLSTPQIKPQRALHEFCFHNFVVALPSHAPPTEYGAWAHPPAPVSEALAALEEREKQPTRLVGSYEPALERHRFAVFPKLSVKLQYAWECLHGGPPFKHHIQVWNGGADCVHLSLSAGSMSLRTESPN